MPPVIEYIFTASSMSVSGGKKSRLPSNVIGSTFHCPVLLPYSGLLYASTSRSIMDMLEPQSTSIMFVPVRYSSQYFWNMDVTAEFAFIRYGNSSMTSTNRSPPILLCRYMKRVRQSENGDCATTASPMLSAVSYTHLTLP